MRKVFPFLLLVLILVKTSSAQNYKILESNDEGIKFEVNFNDVYSIKDTAIDSRLYQLIKGGEPIVRNPGEPWLPDFTVKVGVPFNSRPELRILKIDKIIYKQKFILPFPQEDPDLVKMDINNFDKSIYSSNKDFPEKAVLFDSTYIFRYARILPIRIFPFQYNPVKNELVRNNKILIQLIYNAKVSDKPEVTDNFSEELLKTQVLNPLQTSSMLRKEPQDVTYGGHGYGNYWYDPLKNYYKIFLKDKGIYRITFDQLVSNGVPIQGGVQSNALELINEGNYIPIEVNDGGDGIFNSGDYFQFVGLSPTPSANSRVNIYTNSNVYWFSYQSDTLTARYNPVDGFPVNYSSTVQKTIETLHFEKDTLYEQLGHSNTLNIDHWYWAQVIGNHGNYTKVFDGFFPLPPNFATEEHYLKVKVNMTGMTNFNCSPDHNVSIELTGQPIGTISWDDQTNTTFEKQVYVSSDSIKLYSNANYVNIRAKGLICDPSESDEIRVNWFDLEYYRYNITNGNNFIFGSNQGQNGKIVFQIWNWQRDNIKIYIPSKAKLINNAKILDDQFQSVLFVDTLNTRTDYFCAATDYFLSPDSIRGRNSSDLRNPSNGADYIIITHHDFINAAQRLAELRSNQYPDSAITNPRIMIVDVDQIYDEFSYGMLNPLSLHDFVEYAFQNWVQPAPTYVVLFGDMSHDYRQLLPDSRPNFIPSISFYADTYGEAQSDNLIVSVAGNDLVPDLAIGRMSCETAEEADILMNKLENYPADPGKEWKQDVMLAASGITIEDELHMHFNEAANRIANTFLIPNGIHPSRVYNYPLNAADSMFLGGGPQIRAEIDQGVIIGNYYGHGGGYQWDLIFTNDDIQLLNNPGRLPVIISVTCYTAHFDNQDVFGEQFNKLPGKGSIGFFGNTVLTYWPLGAYIDDAIFKEIFTNRDYTIGKAILNAKTQIGGGGLYGQQIALLTYLGDPGMKLALPDKPDFVIKSSDIKLSRQNPLVNDTVNIKVGIGNLGVVFPLDTINVQLFAESPDTTYLISTERLASFGEADSIQVSWIPDKAGLYNIRVEVNQLDPIPENDHNDNIATAQFVVYNISEANVLYPQDGYSTSDPNIKFKFIDIGHYINLNLTYYIEIDTTLNFETPVISSGAVIAANGFLEWTAPQIGPGTYFWRARIYDGENFGQWSITRHFSVDNIPRPGYYSHGRGLKMFNVYNINYSDSTQSLNLNTSLLPPKPLNRTFLRDISINDPVVDTVNLTAITTDGTYIYFANLWYFALLHNPDGFTKIYKIGTGHNGTIAGQMYGEVPNFYNKVVNSIAYHSDGFIYVTTNDPHHLTKVDPQTGDTTGVNIPEGLLNFNTATPATGIFYIESDGNYIYNLTAYDTSGNNRYVLRVLDPSNNWQLVQPDVETSGTSFTGFCDFFVSDGYIFPTERFYSNKMRRIRASDGYYEEEWIAYQPFQSYYSWCYDWVNDEVIASVYGNNKTPKFSVFQGRHVDANGTITTQDIGPASKWKTLTYDIHQNSSGHSSNILYGLNKNTKVYDTLAIDIPENYSLENISSDYKYLRMYIRLVDSTFNTNEQMRFNSLNVDFDGLPEIMITKNDLNVSPDSVLQGLNTTMFLRIKNVGFVPADSVNIDFSFNDSDSTFLNKVVNIQPDSTVSLQHTFSSTPFIFDNSIKTIATYPKSEYFTFNNVMSHSFYIVRDSVNPIFNITFDGKEIISGDLVSAKPEVVITLKDNSPLPLDTSYFTLIHTTGGEAKILHFSDPELDYDYTDYPNSEAKITWRPTLTQGEHILEILAKDASGNFFDTTSYRINFEVVTEYDLRDVYNYPNPFKNDTYFTFKVTGDKLPDELYIKIYTVAGRLIRTINIPSSALGQDIGFKKVYWDGKDEDGDEIANGVYFYKMIYKVKDVVKSVTQKLAKIK